MKKIFPLLLVVLACIFPSLFIFCHNAEEVGFSEILPVMLGTVAVGCVTYGMIWLINRNSNKAGLIATVIVLVLSNYRFVEAALKKLAPSLYYWQTLPIICLGIWVAACLITWIKKDDLADLIVKVCSATLAVMIVMNLVIAVPGIMKKFSSSASGKKDAGQYVTGAVMEDQPNIYYFIFDEFARGDILQEYYGYDNSSFVDEMERRGFCVSPDSLNGCHSSSTTTITANYMNLNLVVTDADSVAAKNEARADNWFLSMLRENGYDILGAGNTAFMGIHSETSSETKSQAKTMGGDSVQELLLKNTVLYPFVNNVGVYAKLVLDTVDYFRQLTVDPELKTYTVTYLCLPHQPFVFGPNGETLPFSKYYDWDNRSVYLGQLQYAEKVILEITDQLVKKDPDSVIIIQSDHGVRSVAGLSETDKEKVPNMVYYRGQSIDEISGKSAVDTLRIVYSRIFGMDLQLLEEY